jgi:hypothetical protein
MPCRIVFRKASATRTKLGAALLIQSILLTVLITNPLYGMTIA